MNERSFAADVPSWIMAEEVIVVFRRPSMSKQGFTSTLHVALGLPGSRVTSKVVGREALLVAAENAVGVARAALLTQPLSSFS